MAENVEDASTLVDELTRVLEKIGQSSANGGGSNSKAVGSVLECLVAALKAAEMFPSEVADALKVEQLQLLLCFPAIFASNIINFISLAPLQLPMSQVLHIESA